MENITVEIYTDEYKQQVSRLILDIQQKEFHIPITLEQQPDLDNIPDFYKKGNGNFWIALHNGKVIGTTALIDIGYCQVALRKMFVHENYRGKPYQIAQRLLDVALQWMEQKNCKEVYLGTIDLFKAAQRFYGKNGFVEIPRENLPANFPIMKVDNTFFIKEITLSDQVKILDYAPTHQPAFEKLNRDWIEKYFWMEPIDFEVLQHPDKHIITTGGSILLASYNNEIVGVVALKFVTTGVYEFTKMAVDEKFQGKKIGMALAEAAIDKAKAVGAEKIILYSNTKLAPAIALYRKLGFKEVPLDGPYKRSDIKMELPLDSGQ